VVQAPARIGHQDWPAASVAITERIAAAHTRSTVPHVRQTTLSQDRGTEGMASQSQETQRANTSSVEQIARHDAANSKMLRTQPSLENSSESEYCSGVYSAHAGFFFLLRVLDELAIQEFLHAYPVLADINFPRLVLTALAQFLRLAEDDPHLGIAPYSNPESLQNTIAFDMPEAWLRLLGRRSANRSVEMTIRSLVRIWVIAVRRWLWRHGRLRLSEVSSRRGQVFYSRPQVDVKLRLQDVDIRIRCLGLDLDPGWVPWLGLIVRFHYERSLGDGHGT